MDPKSDCGILDAWDSIGIYCPFYFNIFSLRNLEKFLIAGGRLLTLNDYNIWAVFRV